MVWWWIAAFGPASAQDPASDVAEEPLPDAPGSRAMFGCPASTYPEVDWNVGATPPADRVAALDAYLFPPDVDWDDKERRGHRTDGVVVVHAGEIVYERYGPGWDASKKHLVWSVSKTFTNALAGVAVHEGRLDLDDSICEHLDGVREESCAVTVRHLLEFASGWDWRETYEGQSPVTSSVLAMLYGEGRRDMARFVANHPLRDPPGTSWQYSSGETNVLAAVVGAALAERHGERFPWAVLFDPIGMSATWERDAAGTFGGSSYVWATPRHLARFGWLYRNDGCWNGRRILPEDWIADSTRVVDGLRAKPVAWTDDDVQGRQIWLNIAVPEIGQVERPWPSAPEDAYAALGHWRQSITVVPSRDTVIVRVADDRDHTFDHDTFLGLALALVPDEGGTP